MAYARDDGKLQAGGLGQLLIWLRQDLMGELDAINQYQAHIDTIADAAVTTVLTHIRDEEKEHVAELTRLINQLDAVQREKFVAAHDAAAAPPAAAGTGPALTMGGMAAAQDK